MQVDDQPLKFSIHPSTTSPYTSTPAFSFFTFVIPIIYFARRTFNGLRFPSLFLSAVSFYLFIYFFLNLYIRAYSVLLDDCGSGIINRMDPLLLFVIVVQPSDEKYFYSFIFLLINNVFSDFIG